MADELTDWEMITRASGGHLEENYLQHTLSCSGWQNIDDKTKFYFSTNARQKGLEYQTKTCLEDFKPNELIKCLEMISEMPVRRTSPVAFIWDSINWNVLFACLNICTLVGVVVGQIMGYQMGSAGVTIKVISETGCLCVTHHKLKWCNNNSFPNTSDNVTNIVLLLEVDYHVDFYFEQAENIKLRDSIHQLQEQLKKTTQDYKRVEQKSQKVLEINKEILLNMYHSI